VIIGRDRELAEVVERITAGRRLVTVIGPGGIGKTSLALAAADRLGPSFTLGAHVVDLGRVERADAVAGALAAQLGLPSFDALIQSPGEQPALVVVDNCEHVTDAAAETIDALLANCRSPSVLATSRSPLDLPGESIVALGPLALPEPGALGGAADGPASAVALFLDRARHAGATVDATDLDAVVTLCRRLDGMPLAIEIAAARLRSLSVDELLARLDEGIDVLSRPRYRGALRHRSLRDTIAWSYRLLDPEAQAAFDRLGVCVGPFTAATAGAVAGSAGGSVDGSVDGAPVDVLERLVDASLLVADTGEAITRYRMLETVRAAALAQLDARGETAQVRDRFATHVLETVRSVIETSRTSWDGDVLGSLLAEFDNIAAALRHCVATDAEPTRAFLLCAVLWGVVHQAHLDQVHELGLLTLERWPDPARPFAPDAAATLATAQLRLGRVDEAIATAERALPHAEEALFAAVTLRRTLGLAARAAGAHERALHWFAEASAEARARGVATMALECDVFRAQALADGGEREEPLRIVREVAATARAGAAGDGSPLNELWARTVEGAVLAAMEPASAVPVVEAALARSRAIDYPFGITTNLQTLATCRVRLGEHGLAAEAVLEMLDRIGRSGSGDLRLALESAAGVLHAAGRPGWTDLLATAGTLPGPIAMANAGAQLELPAAGTGRVLARVDALRLARQLLAALAGTVMEEPATVEPATADEEAAEAAVFARVGDLWDVRFAGLAVHLRPTKGMEDLATLLAQPGKEVHCLDLTGAGAEQGSAGAPLDAEARRRYEQRVRDLQADIEEAEAHHDIGRAARSQEELDALIDHLAAGLGLGGRGRPQAATAERARSAVAHRLRSTIRRIANVHPPLGRHLEVSVASGTYCSYRPERDVAWITRLDHAHPRSRR
jgi:predicted ATPase